MKMADVRVIDVPIVDVSDAVAALVPPELVGRCADAPEIFAARTEQFDDRGLAETVPVLRCTNGAEQASARRGTKRAYGDPVFERVQS